MAVIQLDMVSVGGNWELSEAGWTRFKDWQGYI